MPSIVLNIYSASTNLYRGGKGGGGGGVDDPNPHFQLSHDTLIYMRQKYMIGNGDLFPLYMIGKHSIIFVLMNFWYTEAIGNI